MERQPGVMYKTNWQIGHKIRKYMSDLVGNECLNGHVEIDETFFGGKDNQMGPRRS